MLKFVNLNKEKYCKDEFEIKTLLKFKGYALQLVKSKVKQN
ncbi:MAG TPA: hypothetical protein PLU55_01345 [Candidatus Pacearchaeota archaeon]|nr:hypothetical protein [Candidatus Pacearchaeota archaeon]